MREPVVLEDVRSYDMQKLVFYVNGNRVKTTDVDPKTTLATYLRDHLKLTGTKIGCNEGGCGACTVMISELDVVTDKIRHFSANACLMPVCSVFGKAVTTVEGIGSAVNGRMHAVQERLAKAHGSQCGFCTPGFVMAMYSLLRNNPRPTEADINEAMQGNLCRCTGYRPILEAFYSFAVQNDGTVKAGNSGCAMGDKCCKVNGSAKVAEKVAECSEGDKCCKVSGTRKTKIQLSNLDDCKPYDPSQEFIFPPELKLKSYHRKSFAIESEGTRWYQPTSYAKLLALKRQEPSSRLISGNSELAIELKFRFIDLSSVINPKQVPELHEQRLDDEKGNDACKTLPQEKTKVFGAIHEMLHWFAGKHVRNVASVAGNIATASPISDLNPIWMASNAKVVLDSEERGEIELPIDEKFFLGYRKTVIRSDEIVKAVWVPFSRENEFFAAYKQAQRREDDIAIVTGAFSAVVNPKTLIVEDMRMAYGGMAPTTKLALNTAKKLIGMKWSTALLDTALASLSEEFKLPPGVPGGMSRYRVALTLSFFFKFFLHVAKENNITEIVDLGEKTFIGDTIPDALDATQVYQEVDESQPAEDPVGRPLKHASGDRHTTGEAVYCDDIPVARCLHMAFVMSPIARGTLSHVDYAKALEMDGVVGYVDASDVKTGAKLGHHCDTPIFVEKEITYHGQPIAAIVAEDHETARRAANAVKVETIVGRPIISIEEAIEHKSFLLKDMVVHSSLNEGGTEVAKNDWSKYDRVVEGEVRIGGQEHFYLETQQCVVTPLEADELDIITSNQGINDVQLEVAKCLGIGAHKIFVRVKRIGGGFGGKESTGGILAVPAALAALKYRRPVKIVLERFDDMAITGTRHPFRLNYRIAVDEKGIFLDLDYTAYSNAGHTLDLSVGVMQRAMVHADNVYQFGNADITGVMCKTNTSSNTAFRGFGGPQGMFGTEVMVKHVCEEYGLDHDEVRYLNMYEEGACTPFGMHLRQCNIQRTWHECREMSDYEERKKAVEQFNKVNKYRKRGIYLLPTKFGIGFGLKQLNQAGSLVLIYTDGTVLVSHGGMEMGQGLHTKILQVAARCLGVPIEKVHIHDTATNKVPNASATAASVGSDMNGLAVQDACRQLNERLEPFKKANPQGKWEDWVREAYVERVSLAASGFGIIHHEPVDFFNGKGAELFGYCVYGTACCEVEVDCLTGDHHLLSTDIVMDIGESLNPAVDIGQIEGAFIQGYGLFTMEEIRIRADGVRLTRGPGNYKIPSADDAPRRFNVALLNGSSNRMGIFSSKAVGEPPLFLGCCAYFAIREAVRAYRLDQGLPGYFRFDSPATPERIRVACEDKFMKIIDPLPEAGSYTPWTVDL
ncbi:unnamed protein product [Caenorhabditis auriculariae]|uniref:xanthine dehydrogenase n=1 Tax=Caenorhabditis auriculariae TaxID=2777116 RepID=A0A8S1HC30_9PELO|nr:unnamed protein product [Caenorhabditis auriculariae]